MSKVDLDAAATFLESVPRGHWTSYGDVAVSGGRRSNAAQGVVSWIGSQGHRLSHVYRVLNSRGEINPAWRPAGPGLPADAAEVRQLLETEGLPFLNGRADPARRWRPAS
jgi:alkylated DNA nucleotide flippase Atl1